MRRFLCFAVLGFVTMGLNESRSQQRLPETIQLTDSMAPPNSLEALWDESTVVARIRIEDATTRELPIGADARIVTDHRATVMESMKGQGLKPNSVINVVLPVGELETSRGTRRALASGLKKFDPGQEVLVFLRYWPAVQGYSLAYGKVGYYELDHPTVAVPPEAQQWRRFGSNRQAIPKAEFLSVIRSLQSRPAKQ